MLPSKAQMTANNALHGYGLGGLDWQANPEEAQWLEQNMPGILQQYGIQGDYNDPEVRGQYFRGVANPERSASSNLWTNSRDSIVKAIPYYLGVVGAGYGLGTALGAGGGGGATATGLGTGEAAAGVGETAGALGTGAGATTTGAGLTSGALGTAGAGVGTTATLAPVVTTGIQGGLGALGEFGLGALGTAGAGMAMDGIGGAAQGAADPGVDTSTAGDGTHETPPMDHPSLAQRAGAYVKDPKNWSTIIKGAGALNSLVNRPGGSGGMPSEGPGSQLPQVTMERTPNPYTDDYYTYGTRAEHKFFNDKTTVAPAGHAMGGPAFGQMVSPLQSLNRAEGNAVRGPGTGRSDDIPAKLSDGEYVIDAETVALLGDGSSEAGSAQLDQMREAIRRHKGAALTKGKFSPNAKSPLAYMAQSKKAKR